MAFNQTELDDMIYHVVYEFRMLVNCTWLLYGPKKKRVKNRQKRNMIEESLWLHERVLWDFFAKMSRPRSDTVMAESYVTTWTRPQELDPPDPPQDHWDALNKRMAHMSVDRLDRKYRLKGRHLREIKKRLLDVFVDFLMDTDLDPHYKKMFRKEIRSQAKYLVSPKGWPKKIRSATK